MENLKQKRATLAKASWIRNIVRILGHSQQEAEKLFEKIKPKLD